MMHGVFARCQHELHKPLIGETALLMENEYDPATVFAQFDNRHMPILYSSGVNLAYGWHLFNKECFDIDPPVNNEEEIL